MSLRTALLAAHIMLLVLASTCFTIPLGLRDGQFQWEYFKYLSQGGWGRPYEFPYSLPVVLTYLAAYAVGLVAYRMAWRNGSPLIGVTGVLLCGVGFASFAYELTHWSSEHYETWIASAPAAAFALAIAAAIQQYRQNKSRNNQPAPA